MRRSSGQAIPWQPQKAVCCISGCSAQSDVVHYACSDLQQFCCPLVAVNRSSLRQPCRLQCPRPADARVLGAVRLCLHTCERGPERGTACAGPVPGYKPFFREPDDALRERVEAFSRTVVERLRETGNARRWSWPHPCFLAQGTARAATLGTVGRNAFLSDIRSSEALWCARAAHPAMVCV